MSNTTRKRPEEEAVSQSQLTLPGKQSPYKSQWQTQLDDTMGKIMNREKFTYDLNGDALWNQYKDQYVTGGKMAMMDTMGQAAALTGGYGNSYAQGVGQQAYQGYLKGLNDKIPELYQLALDSYDREGDALMQQYGMMLDRENTDYGRWTDQRDFGYQQEVNDRNFQYQQDRDKASDDRWKQEFEYGQRIDDRNFQYQQDRDKASDDRWQREFEYGQNIDDRNFQYQQEQDQVDRDYQAQQDARNMAMAMLEAGTMPSEEMLAAAGLTNEFVGALYPQLMPGASGGAGDLTIDRTTKWYTGDDYLDWVGSAQGSAWQSTSQGHAWLYDTVLPTVSSYFDAGEISAAREVLMAMGLTQASIAEVERMYDESKQMS